MVKKSRKIVASVLEVDLKLLKVSAASSWIKELEVKLRAAEKKTGICKESQNMP